MAAAYRGALWAAGMELRPDGTAIRWQPIDVIVVSKDFPGSKRLLREVEDARADLARTGPEFAGEASATAIKFACGTVIEALPCSDKAIRGNTAGVIADEFAFWRQQEDGWAAVKSVTDPNLKYPKGLPGLFVTTPWESGSLAHQIFTDPQYPFRRHSVDIYKAVAAGFPIDPERAFRELGIPELIDTEYLCRWARGGASFFPIQKLRDTQEDELPEGWERARAVFSIDVGGGKGRDFTATVQWRDIEGAQWMTGLKAFNDRPIDEQADIIANWIIESCQDCPHADVWVDQGVMGLALVDLLRVRFRKYPRIALSGVSMSIEDQERYATAGKRTLERGQLKIYTGTDAGGDEEGSRALMLELSQLKVKPGIGGRLKFATPRNPARGHCDRAWAGLIGLRDTAMGAAPGASRVHTGSLDDVAGDPPPIAQGDYDSVQTYSIDSTGIGF